MSNKLTQSEIDALVASLLAADAQEAAKASQEQSESGANAGEPAPGPAPGGVAAGTAQSADFASVTDLGLVTQEELDAAVAASRAAKATAAGTAGAGATDPPTTSAGAPPAGATPAATTPAGTTAAAPAPAGATPAPVAWASLSPAAAAPGAAPVSAAASAPALQRIPPGLRSVLLDIELTLSVELGKVRLPLGDILAMGPGSVITLDRLASEPLEVKINQLPAMKAEVVAIGEKYGIRIVESKLQQNLAS